MAAAPGRGGHPRAAHLARRRIRTHVYATPSGKVELYSERAAALGLPPLPVHEPLPASAYPLAFRQGRTLTQFHGFYDHGRALPTLARLDPEPRLWIAAGRRRGARPRRRRADPHLQRAGGIRRPGARDRRGCPPGTVWMRDGWDGLNDVTSGAAVVPDEAVDLFPFSAGQAAFDAAVEVAPA